MAFDMKQQVDGWRAQLLDTSRRNRLINFKVGRGGGVWLVYPDPGDLWHRLVVRGNQLTFAWKNELLGLPPETEETNQARAHPSTESDLLQRCRTSPRLRPTHLLTDLPDKQLAARLGRLALAAREAASEQGTVTLYVAFGFLRWFESPDSKEEIRSPLLLVPVWLERENVNAPWQLRVEEEEVLPNHSLVQCLKTDFRLSLPAPDEAADTDDATWRTSYFAAVQRLIRNEPRWEVLDETALGTFNFQKLAMWEDLGRHADRIAAHDLCRAIAGDRSIALRIPSDLPHADELDRKTRPEDTYHILDADSSQHEAIVAVTRGANLVLDGPPGTGKSQTIANIIAEFLAAGKTVLFVSEKAAALEVVKKRLDQRGLGDFCLKLHSHKANKREVLQELDRCLKLAPESVRDFGEELRQLEEVRRQLNDYVYQLHQVRQPLGRSVFQVHGELARFSRLTSKSHCSIPQVLERDAGYLDRVTSLLAELPDCRGAVEGWGRHPWRGCRKQVYSLTLREDVVYHFPRLAQLVEVTALLHQLGLAPEQPTWTDCRTALENARRLLRSTSWWEPARRQELANLITSWQQCYLTYTKMREELAPRLALEAFAAPNAEVVVQANRYRSFWTRLLPPWWFLKAKIKRWYKGSPPAVAQLLEDLQKLATYHDSCDFCRRILRERGGEWLRDAQGKVDLKKTQECLRLFEQLERAGQAGPRYSLRARLEEAVRRADAAQAAGGDESWRFLTELFNPAESISTGLIIDRTPLTQLADWLIKQAAEVHQLQEWIRFCDIQRGLQDASVPAFLNDVLAGSVKLEEAADAFRARFFQLWLDAVYTRVPVLQQFQSERHERLRERFRKLDRRSVQLASARIRQQLLSRPDRPRAMVLDVPESSELGILLREVNKRRRHLPLRKLFTAVPTLLPRLKPCLMMSPLAVSTHLPPDLQLDLVIFDEASQVRPQDTICAIYRGRHLLVAGDQKQLPPTSFFERFLADEQSTVEEADEGGLEDFESILDVCCTLGLPRCRLRWHYRSRREALIAFSNRHFYDNELVTFPSVYDLANNPAITFEYISEGRWKIGRGGGFTLSKPAALRNACWNIFAAIPSRVWV
jgi:hypothetical protein